MRRIHPFLTGSTAMLSRIPSKGFSERFNHEWLDRWLYFILLGLGSVLIIGLKLAGAGQIMVTAPPVLLMVGYAWLILKVERFQLPEDRAGDNLYYMGFIFTLVSLALALYLFASGDRDATLIVNFGVALATTIFGMGLRLLAVQMRRDPVEAGNDARTALSKTVARFTGDLEVARSELKAFQARTQQAAADSIAEAFAAMRACQDQHTEMVARMIAESEGRQAAQAAKLAAAVSGMAAQVEHSVAAMAGHDKAFAASAKVLVDAVGRLGTRLSKQEAAIASSLEGLVDGLQAIRPDADLIDRQVAPLREATARLVAAIEQREATEQKATGGMAATAEGLARLVPIAEALTARLEAVGLAADRFNQVADAGRAAVERQAGAAGEMLENGLERARRLNEGLEEELARSRKLTGRLAGELAGIAQLIERRLAEPDPQLGKVA
jgi:hypothetical protein